LPEFTDVSLYGLYDMGLLTAQEFTKGFVVPFVREFLWFRFLFFDFWKALGNVPFFFGEALFCYFFESVLWNFIACYPIIYITFRYLLPFCK